MYRAYTKIKLIEAKYKEVMKNSIFSNLNVNIGNDPYVSCVANQ